MPVELNIVESVTELDTTVVTVVLESASEPGPAGPGVPAGGTTGQALVKASDTDYDTEWGAGGGGGGAPTDATYLVTTANGDLSAEVVVGATPGGELGGTWASPTVDATHSGSSHAAVQAAAEATAAAALSAHLTDTTDAHDASAISSVAAGNLAATDVQSALNELDTEKAAATHAHAGEDITSGTVADARIASTIARDSEVTSAISAHEADTTSVHGIADTSALALTANVVTKALYDANTVLAADSDDTPAAVTMAASTILARLAAGNIKAASVSEIRTLLDVPTNAEAILDALVDAKGDLLVGTAADTVARLAVGSNDQVLTADSGQTAGVKWATPSSSGIAATIFDAKGDLIAATAADTAARLAVGGTNGMALVVASGESTGLKYALPPGYEFDYAEATSPVTVSSTTEAGANTIVSGSSVSYDGSTAIIVEFGAYAVANGGSTFQVVITLWDGSTDLGRIAQVIPYGSSVGWVPVYARRRLTPSNGAHTFHIKAWRVGGDGSVQADAGGTAAGTPAYIRITKV